MLKLEKKSITLDLLGPFRNAINKLYCMFLLEENDVIVGPHTVSPLVAFRRHLKSLPSRPPVERDQREIYWCLKTAVGRSVCSL